MKKVVIFISALATIAFLRIGFINYSTVQADPSLSAEDIKSQLSKQYPGEITNLELDNQSKEPVYYVEMNTEGNELELSLDGHTGEVLRYKEKLLVQNAEAQTNGGSESEKLVIREKATIPDPTLNTDKSATNTVTKAENQDDVTVDAKTQQVETTKVSQNETESDVTTPMQKGTNEDTIGLGKAKRIALEQFKGHIEEFELDDNDGNLVYELEIENESQDAEVQIDAYTGKVMKLEIDDEDD